MPTDTDSPGNAGSRFIALATQALGVNFDEIFERVEDKVRLRTDRFDEITRQLGWHNDFARARQIGVSHTTILRLRGRKPDEE